jgi:glycosyltransferase A (GT-A) superfamily protein (DUF2064 family)
MIGTLIVIAKQPIAGRVKTRLAPPLSHRQAARVALASLVDTLQAMALVPAWRHLLVLDGMPGGWLPAGWDVAPQPAGGLDQRLVDAFRQADPTWPAVLVGMDTPQLRPEHVLAFKPDNYDACLGLAEDGGYWGIGLRFPNRAAAVISGVPMSTTDTGAAQLQRLTLAGMRTQLLVTLADVDTFSIACQVAAQAPHSRFAALIRELAPLSVPG